MTFWWHFQVDISFNTLRRRQMDAISQTTFSNAFSWMKMFEFRLKFHWSLFPRVQLTIFQQWFRWWLGAVQATSHYLNQWWLVRWRIYVSLSLNELMKFDCVLSQISLNLLISYFICSGNIRIKGIGSLNIDLIVPEYSSLSIEI